MSQSDRDRARRQQLREQRRRARKARARAGSASRPRPDSLFVQSLGAKDEPEIALVSRFLEASDLAPSVPSLDAAIANLRKVPVERALDWVARCLAGSVLPGDLWEQQQQEMAVRWFNNETSLGRHARELVRTGRRRLLAPHVLYRLARLALLHCAGTPAGDHETVDEIARYEQSMIAAMLIVGSHLSSRNMRPQQLAVSGDQSSDDPISGIELDIAANLLANHRWYAPSTFHRSQRRWIEIPAADDSAGAINLAGEYEDATGVPLDDLRTVGLALWARASGDDGPRFRREYLGKLGLGRARIDKVMALISAPISAMAAEAAGAGPVGDYDTSIFGRHPIVELLDGQMLVISPSLLVERTLGWVPRWDLDDGFKHLGKEGARRSSRAVGYLRKATETHAVETLYALAAPGRRARAVFTESDIQKAYGTRDRNADVAIAWKDQWIVAEISARPVMRGTAAGGSAADLLDDLNRGILAKAEQLDATIAAIRNDPTKLAGAPPPLRTRFAPVLVTTEGFPVTPMMTRRIRAMLNREGWLQRGDTAPLVVVDIDGLEVAESIAETGGPDLPTLLAEHRRSPMKFYGFRDWMLYTYGSRQAPKRIMDSWDRVLDPIIRQLQASEVAGAERPNPAVAADDDA